MSQIIKRICRDAENLASRTNQDNVNLSCLTAAILGNKQVEIYLETRGITMQDLRNEHLSHSLEKSEDNSNQRRVRLAYSTEVEELIKAVSLLYYRDAETDECLEGLITLQILLKEFSESKALEVLVGYGISSSHIESYMRDLNPATYIPDSKTLRLNPPKYVLPKDSETALAKYTTCLNDEAQDGKIPPVIGRENEILQAMRILRRKNKSNPMLVGEAGVGKTAIVEALANAAYEGRLPEDLDNIKIFSLDVTSLIEGTRYRGDFEERMKLVLKELKEIDGAVLFIDEFHTSVGAGAASSPNDITNMLKPAMARGEISVIGATTFAEYKKYVQKDEALGRRFGQIKVGEPSPEETIEILKGIKERYEDHHYCEITDDAVEKIVSLTGRYITDRNFPDKAIDLMDDCGATLKEDLDPQVSLEGCRGVVTEEIILRALSARTGIPLNKLDDEDGQKVLSIKRELAERVYDQNNAIEKVGDAYIMARAGMNDPDRPLGSFFFRGPTGVGKTQLAKTLAEKAGLKFIRFDMSEYSERHSGAKLIGSPPGYVGYHEGGKLTEVVHRNGHAVILLDEMEKAHPEVYNLFLQVMDNGELTDGSGKVVNFRNTILIMTSNVGAGAAIKTSAGFGDVKETDGSDAEFEVSIFSRV